ncbi:hypothetical protein [Bradyrhizobium japonicum]|uniref:hypothetical protein n=1 Tax=Bradyrhizobium japonicum TaxID=375 RepID=UPI002714EDCB|nr:hypothetical protein [Bradyrhizobium japonicum]WLB52134.1 hypothetical protein QIH94_32925 [Bradyrhizobium japonicum]WLB66094.1 hypothetical protein QIH96_13390 [Bradyrhizobium japonicum]
MAEPASRWLCHGAPFRPRFYRACRTEQRAFLAREFCAEMQDNLIGWPEAIERYLDLIGISVARRR